MNCPSIFNIYLPFITAVFTSYFYIISHFLFLFFQIVFLSQTEIHSGLGFNLYSKNQSFLLALYTKEFLLRLKLSPVKALSFDGIVSGLLNYTIF